jgi:FAD:protein FMN transferase
MFLTSSHPFQRSRWWRGIRIVLLVVTVRSAIVAEEPIALTGRAMGTTWSVKYLAPKGSPRAAEVEQRVAERLERLEQIFSTFRPNSEISRFNATGGTGWVNVSPELATVAVEARRVSEITGGAFDVTVDPLVRLWGFGPQGRGRTLPTPQELAAIRLRVDWRQLHARTDAPALKRGRAGITADFELLAGLELNNHFVQIGGDVKAAGAGPGGAGWRTGIETPAYKGGKIARVVSLSAQALSTSGDYQNYITQGEQRYSHIINPLTGRPAGSELAAVTVVHPSCAKSSALATALFVLGPENGFEFAAKERLACLFFLRETKGPGFTQRMTPEFEALIAQP